MAHVTLLPFSAPEMEPDQNAVLVGGDVGCGKVVNDGRMVLSFDDTAEEAVITPTYQMPGQYAGGTLKATAMVIFEDEVIATSDAIFDIAVEAITPGDSGNVLISDTFDSLNVGNKVSPPTSTGYLTSFTVTLTNKDSVAAGDAVRFAVRRDIDLDSDTCVNDVYIVSLEIWEDTA